MSYLSEQYRTTVLPNKKLFIRRASKNAYIMFMIAAFLMIDFMIDYVNLLPDFLGGLMFIFGALYLRKYTNTKKFLIRSVVFTAVSLVSWIVLCCYAIKYQDVYIYNNMEAYSMFKVVNIFNIIKYIAAVFVVISLYKLYDNLITEHTGSAIDELQSVTVKMKLIQLELRKSNKFALIFGITACLVSVVRMILLYGVSSFIIVDIGVNFVWFVFAYKLFSKVNESIDYKYL